MSEPRAANTPDESEATLVTPRFDEEETVLAQPVVPLDASAAEASAAPPNRAGRRQWPMALALISALVGSIVGGLGLYLFQQHRRAGDATVQQSSAPAEVSQPAPAPTVEQVAENAPAEAEVIAPVETAPAAEPDEDEDSPGDEKATRADARRDDDDDRDDDRAAAAPPPAREAPAPATTPKRGKKGERDADLQRRRQSAPPDSNPPVVLEGGARRVDTIVYPSRRAERRAERRARRAARNVDRVRAIFEGQPE